MKTLIFTISLLVASPAFSLGIPVPNTPNLDFPEDSTQNQDQASCKDKKSSKDKKDKKDKKVVAIAAR